MVSSVSPCGTYRVIGATIGGAKRVLDDLSHAEAAEKERLGLVGFKPMFDEIVAERAWLLVRNTRPYEELAIFGVGEEYDRTMRARSVWFLPTQTAVETCKRDLASKEKAKWLLDFIWSSIPTDLNKEPIVLFNGVTPQNKAVLRWLKKVVGARVANHTVPNGPKQVQAHPFFLHHEPDYV